MRGPRSSYSLRVFVALFALAQLGLAEGLESTPSSSSSTNSPREDSEALPPVPLEALTVSARQPSWDTGLLMAACGVGESPLFQRTRFCLGGMVDALYFRKSENSAAFGGYGQVSTSGFRDLRASLGASGLIPLVSWVNLGLRGGALVVANSEGVAPGLEAFVELGQRSFSLTGRYSMSHMLFAGVQWNAAGVFEQPSGTTIWLGVRLDGYWLSLPGLLFQ